MQRPFTRIVAGWGRAYRAVKEYIELNRLEAEGHIRRAETKSVRVLKEMLASLEPDPGWPL